MGLSQCAPNAPRATARKQSAAAIRVNAIIFFYLQRHFTSAEVLIPSCVCIPRKARRKPQTHAREFRGLIVQESRTRLRSSANLRQRGADWWDTNPPRGQFPQEARALVQSDYIS